MIDDFFDLNHNNALDYASLNYDCYIKSEFIEDYKTFSYLKRLLQKYRLSGELKKSLILNHLHIIYNVFGAEAGTRLLFLKVDVSDYSTLKTFLLFMNLMPNTVHGICGRNIDTVDIPVDMVVAGELRKL